MQATGSQTASFAGRLDLSAREVRVLGCLLEKQRTTPDAYPLSLNALCLACNQSTNRDPVVDYDQATVRDALHRLQRRGFTRLASGAGSRAPKYRHLLDEALPMSRAEQALMCVLMLRGPQTPGELKQRTERMRGFEELSEVLQTLDGLIERGLVSSLPRRPGQKEQRYRQLLEGEDENERAAPGLAATTVAEAPVNGGASAPPPTAPHVRSGGADAALQELHERVARLERELRELRAAIGHPVSQND